MAKLVLRKILRKKRISVKQFSRLAKLDHSTAFRVLRKDYNPTLKSMSRWAKALGCRVRDLIAE